MNEPSAPRPKLARMTNFDGIRGIGIAIVILYHLGHPSVNSGWVCISYFFSMSGFLITAMTVQKFESTGEINIVKFWSLRIGRLFPALLLTISVCASSKFFRVEDEKELMYERNDLLFGLSSLTNYNLAFVRRDDYFAHFTKPSITRHMWSLAIEEQYYAIWPVIFYAYTRIFPLSSKQTGLVSKLPRKSYSAKDALSNESRLRRFLIALCIGEGFVMVLSHIASLVTYSKLGVSAAYYSTWCRMGDLACGGLVFLLVRLHPQIYRRICNDPGMEPIQFKQRLALELICLLTICLILFPAMIQAPFETIFHYYIRYARFPMSFVLYSLAVAGVVQISEPLPRWAIFSRALNSKVLTTLGSISYGVYLYHWPIIFFLAGNSNDESDDDIWIGYAGNDEKSQSIEAGNDEKSQSIELNRLSKFALDSFIVFISILSGYLSFFWFESPLLLRARRSKPSKVLLGGFLGASFTAAFVVTCFLGVSDPDKELAGHSALPYSSWFSHNFFTTRGKVLLKTAAPPMDERHTPIWLFAMKKGHPHERMHVTLADILDNMTIPVRPIQCQKVGLFDDIAHDNSLRCGEKATPVVYSQLIQTHTENAVIIMCKSLSYISPCDVGPWKKGTKWLWLDSPLFCGESNWSDTEEVMKAHQQYCPDSLDVHSMLIDAGASKVSGATTFSYTGNTDEDLFYLTKLIVSIEKKIPGAINRESLHRVEGLLSIEEEKISRMNLNSIHDGDGDGDSTKILVMGESVAFRIARFFIELSTFCMEGYNQGSDMNLPKLQIINKAIRGHPTISCFLPQNKSEKANDLGAQAVRESIPLTRPDVVVLKDGHWKKSGKRADRAMTVFLKQAFESNVRHIFFLTGSTSSPMMIRNTMEELHELEQFSQHFQKKKNCSRTERKISFNVVKWHLLTCPTFTSGECPRSAHGFNKILPDGMHPSGTSGQWLAAQVLAIVLGQISYLEEREISLKEALENDVTVIRCLLSENAPDNNPFLKDLVQSEWICESDLAQLL